MRDIRPHFGAAEGVHHQIFNTFRLVEVEVSGESGFFRKPANCGVRKAHVPGSRGTSFCVREGDVVGYGILELIVDGEWADLGLTEVSPRRVEPV